MSRSPVAARSEAERAEDMFFAALRTADAAELEELVGEDLLLVDVSSGAVVGGAAFVRALRGGLLEFHRVELVERVTREYGDTAVVVGRTELAGAFQGEGFAVSSRYTHVFVRGGDGRWLLVSAQGTPIAEQ